MAYFTCVCALSAYCYVVVFLVVLDGSLNALRQIEMDQMVHSVQTDALNGTRGKSHNDQSALQGHFY